jgi:ABC-type multidrug transport system fused ATPase/permease subunit
MHGAPLLVLAHSFAAVASALFTVFMALFAPAGLMLVLWYGARLVITGHLTVGELSSFILYSLYVGSSAGSLSAVFASVISGGWRPQRGRGRGQGGLGFFFGGGGGPYRSLFIITIMRQYFVLALVHPSTA